MRAAPILAAALAILAACATPETTRRADLDLSLPPPAQRDGAGAQTPAMPNGQIARDFLDLSFRLENGQEMLVFTRFEGSVTVRVAEPAPASLRDDLQGLLSRLRREAGLDIRLARPGERASISIQTVTRRQILSVAPSAACFVRPNVSDWQEYRARRNDPATFWSNLTERRQMAVFLPTDVSAQEMRDCLHEEIAQALGPVNDLYRLTQSVFNDDNFHTVLTGYDMLILRATYDPALRNGMTRAEVAARLPGILARLNPSGGREAPGAAMSEPPEWRRAIDTATRSDMPRARRISAARRAIEEAAVFGPLDPRLAFSHYVHGRLTLASEPNEALRSFVAAGRIYQNRPDTAVQEAHVAMQIAAFQLSLGRSAAAISIVDRNLPAVRRSGHAALLSLMLLVKAEALELAARPDEAAAVQREALSWARYGFETEADVRERVAEIRAISPRTRREIPS